jgi:signal transduction histidine kinase
MRSKLIYIADTIIVLISILGFYHVYEKAGLPVIFDHKGLLTEQLRENTPKNKIMVGDKLIAIDSIKVRSQEDIEFLLDGKTIGDEVILSVDRNKSIIQVKETLVNFYTIRYLVVQIAVAAAFIFLALFVYLKRPDDLAAQVFHWVMLSVSLIISTTWGRYTIEPNGLGHFLRIVFNGAYAFTPILFVHFTFVFPYRKSKRELNYLTPLYLIALLFTLGMAYEFVHAAIHSNINWFRAYNSMFNLNRMFFMVTVLFGIGNIIHTYIVAREESERRKIRWIILGLAFGPMCFIFLWVVPQIITSRGLVEEEFVLIAMLSVPIAFAVSIVKYHILNIDQIFRRGTIYTIVLFAVLFIYAVIVGSTSLVVGVLTVKSSLMASSLAGVVIAVAFQPIKLWTQNFVDRKFFNVRFNYRIAEKNFIDKIKYCFDENIIAKVVVDEIIMLIPSERIFFVIKNEETLTVESINDEYVSDATVKSIIEVLEKTAVPIAADEHIELGTVYLPASKELFRDSKLAIAFGIYAESGQAIGSLMVGPKKSGLRFNLEETDLLESFCHQIALALSRINLQKNVLKERMEADKLKVLNETKSFFVSSVTHDLKTPLTSIKMFAEMIEDSPKLEEVKRNEFLKIIQGETARLSRLIDNVLDLVKIERGIKEYHFANIDLNYVVNQSLKAMEYQIKLNGFECKIELSNNVLYIQGDKDAIEEALINIISNALKYSQDNKTISIKTEKESNHAVVSVADKGIGIPKENLEKIFEPYERVNSKQVKSKTGTGIGLAVVKHIADAHSAILHVESEIGKGSKFSLKFNLKEE